MDERELLDLLTGVRTHPIRMGRISQLRASLIGAGTNVVMLSRDTLTKQEIKHRDATLNLYRIGAASLCSLDARVDPPRKMNFLLRSVDGKEYRTTIKANGAGTEIYMVSVHELKKNQWKSTCSRTYSESEWRHRQLMVSSYGQEGM
jgi:hypothetical protein